MLTGKQKRYLRGLGSKEEPVLHIGKNGINENCLVQAEGVLATRELIKVKVLKTCAEPVSEVADSLAETLRAEVVQVIGRNFLLYKYSHKDPKIELPE